MTRENTVSSILMTRTPDNDSIINYGDDVTIDSGSGDDVIDAVGHSREVFRARNSSAIMLKFLSAPEKLFSLKQTI